MVPNTKYLIPQILIVDSKQDNWNKDEEGVGCVNFLSREILDSILDLEEQPEAILQQCRAMDAGYVYEELREIRTPQDIGNLEWASGGFHDTFIAEEKKQEDGRLYLKFDGTWGCNIEVWFWGDLDYNNPVVEPEDGDPYWYDSTIILHDGFIYFVDDEISSIDQIRSGHYHFKARHMQYRIIPN